MPGGRGLANVRSRSGFENGQAIVPALGRSKSRVEVMQASPSRVRFRLQFQRNHGPAQAKTDVSTHGHRLRAGSTVPAECCRPGCTAASSRDCHQAVFRNRSNADTASRNDNGSCHSILFPFVKTYCHEPFEALRFENGLSPRPGSFLFPLHRGIINQFDRGDSPVLENRVYLSCPKTADRKCANRSKSAGIGRFEGSAPGYG